ncbi:hypothetical protein [Merismopedia glauca]|uniref:Metal-dependent hydrolase n=1 Tax=Merismopedia glauca CCAP 1448/3 TaxID=1296344 RepID=A0A2T1CAQ9_9CYAN|nr:hypothetical protein [Merismopedia glauca]PSB05248.1 hypothetical protein C7B64_00125 [Merismopedia glauca CCAP 1448/3]
MNTPSHAILNLAILGQQHKPQFNLAIVIGAILPDIPIFIFYFVSKFISKLPEKTIWTEAYYQPLWQDLIATFHSFPLALIAWGIARYQGWKLAEIICLSLVWHSLLDIPVHSEDAHRHFFPFSNYRFISPISYWNPRHYGNIVSPIERLIVLVASFYVFPWVSSYVGKSLIVMVNLVYIISYFYMRR